jgi:hypothetical protein
MNLVIPATEVFVVPRRNVRSDIPLPEYAGVEMPGGQACRAGMNQQGAVFAILADGRRLGLRPGEFDFVCPYVESGETMLPAGQRACGHPWRVIGVGVTMEVAGKACRVVRVEVGAAGWHLELEEAP